MNGYRTRDALPAGGAAGRSAFGDLPEPLALERPAARRGARLSRRGRQVLFTMSNSKTRRQRPERDPPPLPPHHDGGFPGFNPLPGRPPMRIRPGKAECAIPQVRTHLAGWPAGAVRTRRDRTQAAPPPRSPGRRTRPDARSRLRSYPYPGPRMAPLPPVSFPARFHPAPYLYGTLSTPAAGARTRPPQTALLPPRRRRAMRANPSQPGRIVRRGERPTRTSSARRPAPRPPGARNRRPRRPPPAR